MRVVATIFSYVLDSFLKIKKKYELFDEVL